MGLPCCHAIRRLFYFFHLHCLHIWQVSFRIKVSVMGGIFAGLPKLPSQIVGCTAWRMIEFCLCIGNWFISHNLSTANQSPETHLPVLSLQICFDWRLPICLFLKGSFCICNFLYQSFHTLIYPGWLWYQIEFRFVCTDFSISHNEMFYWWHSEFEGKSIKLHLDSDWIEDLCCFLNTTQFSTVQSLHCQHPEKLVPHHLSTWQLHFNSVIYGVSASF